MVDLNFYEIKLEGFKNPFVLTVFEIDSKIPYHFFYKKLGKFDLFSNEETFKAVAFCCEEGNKLNIISSSFFSGGLVGGGISSNYISEIKKDDKVKIIAKGLDALKFLRNFKE